MFKICSRAPWKLLKDTKDCAPRKKLEGVYIFSGKQGNIPAKYGFITRFSLFPFLKNNSKKWKQKRNKRRYSLMIEVATAAFMPFYRRLASTYRLPHRRQLQLRFLMPSMWMRSLNASSRCRAGRRGSALIAYTVYLMKTLLRLENLTTGTRLNSTNPKSVFHKTHF